LADALPSFGVLGRPWADTGARIIVMNDIPADRVIVADSEGRPLQKGADPKLIGSYLMCQATADRLAEACKVSSGEA
jgi:hypothetical protein